MILSEKISPLIWWLVLVLVIIPTSGLIDFRAQGMADNGVLDLEGDAYHIRIAARAEGPVSFGTTQKIDTDKSNVFLGLDAPGEGSVMWKSPIQDFRGNGSGLLVEMSGSYSSITTITEDELIDEVLEEKIWEKVTTRQDLATSDIDARGNGSFRNRLYGAYPGKGRFWKISDITISGQNTSARFLLNASGQNVKREWGIIEEEEGEGAKA
jgi:hypothetical protein